MKLKVITIILFGLISYLPFKALSEEKTIDGLINENITLTAYTEKGSKMAVSGECSNKLKNVTSDAFKGINIQDSNSRLVKVNIEGCGEIWLRKSKLIFPVDPQASDNNVKKQILSRSGKPGDRTTPVSSGLGGE